MSFSTDISPHPSDSRPTAPAPRPVLQRKCSCGGNAAAGGECEECRKKKLQRRSRGSDVTAGDAAPPVVHDVIRSPGQPLDHATRATFNARFDKDFGRVRIHTDSYAAESAGAVNAEAYTVGPHIVFGSGGYQPREPAGQRLLAHELTHTIQQSGAGISDGALTIASSNDSHEAAARASESSFNSSASMAGTGSVALQRQEAPDAGEEQPVPAEEKKAECPVKSEGTLSTTSWGETGGLYPTSSGKGLYDPAKWDCAKLQELLKCRVAIHAVCQRGESCHSSSPPKADAFAQSIKKYHFTENFPALDPEVADAEVKWFFLSQDENAEHPGITGETKVKSYGPFYNVGGGDVAKGMTNVNFYKVPAKK